MSDEMEWREFWCRNCKTTGFRISVDPERAIALCLKCSQQIEKPYRAFISFQCSGCGQAVTLSVSPELQLVCKGCCETMLLQDYENDRKMQAVFLKILEQYYDEGKVLSAWGGGMSHLCLFTDAWNKRHVMKIPKYIEEGYRNRFLREAENMAEAKNSGIVQIEQWGEREGVPFLVMPYIDGLTWEKWNKSSDRTHLEIMDVAGKVCRSLAVLHDLGIVHRDIKPSNIIITHGNEPVLLDLGIARRAAEGMHHGSLTDTVTGTVIGTIGYMAPEQANAEKEKQCPATDVFGVGVILYEFLTGGHPFLDDELSSLADYINSLKKDAVALQERNRTIHLDICRICMKALERECKNRYANGREMQEDIVRFLENQAVQAKFPPFFTRINRWRKRHRGKAAFYLALVFSAVNLILGSGWHYAQESFRYHAERSVYEAGVKAAEKNIESEEKNSLPTEFLWSKIFPHYQKMWDESSTFYYRYPGTKERTDHVAVTARYYQASLKYGDFGKARYLLAELRIICPEKDWARAFEEARKEKIEESKKWIEKVQKIGFHK